MGRIIRTLTSSFIRLPKIFIALLIKQLRQSDPRRQKKSRLKVGFLIELFKTLLGAQDTHRVQVASLIKS